MHTPIHCSNWDSQSEFHTNTPLREQFHELPHKKFYHEFRDYLKIRS